ncbi:BBSome complex assembly protein BBS10 [Austrofundulus limnaeus]|uniref:BBSome complex assembly protein BBS10 n=1 Tax=Austrofundulus limnaeus TaxID=52670 RepID=A0A2I4ATY6_AUSLI|nr:PREDICTED: Bardet-Biedl syndrome 10 protein [Austrofundulus limnaeus]
MAGSPAACRIPTTSWSRTAGGRGATEKKKSLLIDRLMKSISNVDILELAAVYEFHGEGMTSVEHLHLKHVLQTVCALEAVVLRSFGPDGGQVLFTRSTGQAMLSRSGTQILKALHLEHPLARVVVDCVCKHSAVTGDGSKTFVLLLASLLRMIHASASKAPIVSECSKSTEAAAARRLADKLLAFATSELADLISVSVVPRGFCVSAEDFTTKTQPPARPSDFRIQTLLSSFFHTRLDSVHCGFLSDLACELLTRWKFQNDKLSFFLQFLSDNFPALHTQVSGFPVSSSRLIEGQVIHRDFSTPCLQVHKQPVRAAVFTEHLQPTILHQSYVLELRCGGRVTGEESIVPFSARTERSLESVIATLQSFGVSLLLCAVKQSTAVLALAARAEMCLVECVSEDELSLFVRLSGVTPISDCWRIQPENIATLTFCRAILLGAHRYVHVAFCDSSGVKPCSLVICAPGEAQTDQCTSAFQDAVRVLLTMWEPVSTTEATTLKNPVQPHEGTSLHAHCPTGNAAYRSDTCALKPGCVIPAGGTFEFLLHHGLTQHSRSHSASSCTNLGVNVCQILANTLLSVPRQIYSHHPKRFLQAQTRITSLISDRSRPFMAFKNVANEDPDRGDTPSKRFMLDLGLESISCKYQLLLAVLQCATSLLRVDAMVRTHTALCSPSHKLTNISEESTDDETED